MDTVVAHHRAFAHGIASGDPTTNAVVIWTRIERYDQPAVAVG